MMKQNTNPLLPELAQLIDHCTNYIVSQGYSKSAIKQHTSVWKRLQEFADLNGDKFFSLDLASRFMKESYGINNIFIPDPKSERWRVRYVWCLDDFSKHKCFMRHREYNVPLIPEFFNNVYSVYEEYLTNKNQSSRSISTKLARIKVFLLFLHKNDISKTEKVSSEIIIKFIVSLKYSSAYRGNILLTLRDFLKCPAISKLFQEGLVDMLQSVQLNRYERLPSFYSNEEICKVLSVIDRNTSQGKKDYAIIILAVELGLRVSDIRKLCLNEIKWDKNTIELFQQKTGDFLELYMTDNVKWILLDYLMNARQKDSQYLNVFLRSKAPYAPYGKTATFHERINKYISLAGIKTEGKHHGLHACRHALATRLMNDGTPITVVSEALGHRFVNVTKEYTRISIHQLRLIALEVDSDE